MGVDSSAVSGANKPREVSPRNTIKPMTTMNASTSQREAISLKNANGAKRFILFPRERRWPSGRRGMATGVALRACNDVHFSMFAKVLWAGFLVYCMDVQLSIFRRSGHAVAGEGQARCVALRLG